METTNVVTQSLYLNFSLHLSPMSEREGQKRIYNLWRVSLSKSTLIAWIYVLLFSGFIPRTACAYQTNANHKVYTIASSDKSDDSQSSPYSPIEIIAPSWEKTESNGNTNDFNNNCYIVSSTDLSDFFPSHNFLSVIPKPYNQSHNGTTLFVLYCTFII